MKVKFYMLVGLVSGIFYFESTAQKTVSLQKENFTTYNRVLSVKDSNHLAIVHIDAKPSSGVAWLKDINFKNGVIEFDVKGKNVQQQSFVGIAFHGLNDSTYDAVYFRPFNFTSDDAVRKSHSVQYISMPKYEWYYLREKFTGKFEDALTKAVDPDKWFHAKIVVDKNEVNVYADNDDKPSLSVKTLNNYGAGKIGFWVGNDSDGDFTNLIIKQ